LSGDRLAHGTAGTAVASHKSKSPHANPKDCAVEVDPLNVCLDLPEQP
jgi:hypothetical protein